MNHVPSPVPFNTAATQASHPAAHTDVIELLALIAHIEANAFIQVSSAAANSPDPAQRLTLTRIAGRALERQEMLLTCMTELGITGEEAEECMFGFGGSFDDYNARTEPSTIWESLLKEYVGHGVADDFCRIIASRLDPRTRNVVTTVLDGAITSGTVVETLETATSEDEILASRLALWGRRLVGEALNVVQGLIAQHPALARLIEAAVAERFATEPDKMPTDISTWLFAQLTAEHTRRMGRLGLAA